MAPADDYVAAGERVAVVAEILALKLKFDVNALPAVGSDLAQGFAIGKALLHRFDEVAEIFGEHAEEEYDALFVERFMAQAEEVGGIAVGSAALERRVLYLPGRNCRTAFVGSRVRVLYRGASHGSRNEGQDVGPFALASGEIAKGSRHGGPAAESVGECVGTIFPLTPVDVPRESSAGS